MPIPYDERHDETYLTGIDLERAITRRADELVDEHMALIAEARPLVAALLAVVQRAERSAIEAAGPCAGSDWCDLAGMLRDCLAADDAAERYRVRGTAESVAEGEYC